MKGDPRIINALNARLVEEATGINQYSANIGLLRNWQFDKLVDYVKERRKDERRHYDMLINQILFLGGVPVSGLLNPVHPGKNVAEMLILDHATEQQSIDGYNATIALCLEVGDEITANVLRKIIKDEADHINDIEARQMQINQIGIGPFLAVQIGD